MSWVKRTGVPVSSQLSAADGPPADERFCTALVLLGSVIRFPFYIFCCRPQGTCAFIHGWLASYVGQSGGACINNYSVFNLPSFTPPVRVTVGEVRYSIEIDVGGGKGSILQTRILRKILAENGPTYKQPGSYFSKFKWSKNCPIFEIDPTTARAEPKNANKDPFSTYLPSPPL